MNQTIVNIPGGPTEQLPLQAAITPIVSFLQPLFKEAVDLSINEAVERAVDKALQKYSDLCKPMETYTRQQVCDVCHITLPTFHAWVKEGTLRTTKVNGRTLVSKEELDAVMKAKKIVTFKHED